MNLQIAVELILAAGAALLLARDVRRAWRDPLRRPVLFVLSNRREPRPWRADDVAHYERRAVQRRKA